jgi:chitodextrinase
MTVPTGFTWLAAARDNGLVMAPTVLRALPRILMARRHFSALLASLAFAAAAQGTTYVVGPDAELVDQAPLIVAGEILEVSPAPGAAGPATDYVLEVHRVLKGEATTPTLRVRLPGGPTADGGHVRVFGVPSFAVGERVLLLLGPERDGAHRVWQLALGAFAERTVEGRRVARRDFHGARLLAVDPLAADPQPVEMLRDFDRFTEWVADRALGVARPANYWVRERAVAPASVGSVSDAYEFLGDPPAHWPGGSAAFNFQSAGFDGSGGGFSAVAAGCAAWNQDPASDISYSVSLGGAGSAGLTRPDGVNSILFNDPHNEMEGAFACGSGGVLALGGYTNASGIHAFKGRTFYRISEGDIVVNDGVACYFQGRPTIQEEVFAHELGHTLGLGHSGCWDALMYFSANGGGATLTADDSAGVSCLYGSGPCNPSPSCTRPPPPPPSPPAAPTALQAAALTTSQIQLGWRDNSNNETSFRIEMRSGGGAFSEISSTNANSTGVSIPGLQAATTYTFRVRARNGSGNSAYTNEASATTLSPPPPPPGGPAAPSSLHAAAQSTSRIRLDWSDNSGNEAAFHVEMSAGGSSYSEVGAVGANGTTTDIDGLQAATSYSFRVRARNAKGFSTYSNTATATTQGGSPAPPPSCSSDPDTICLQGNRFAVSLDWISPSGQRRKAHPLRLTDDSVTFWFQNPANTEVLVKVHNACALPGQPAYWVFAAGLTNVNTELRVRDTRTARSRFYENPQGRPFQPIQDTDAFETCGIGSLAEAATTPAPLPPVLWAPAELAAPATNCTTDSTRLCLRGGRFKVETFWRASDGRSGTGTAVKLGDQSGYFWFFNPANVEVLAKVHDACALSPARYWVFGAGLTNVEVKLRITDLLRNQVREYVNPLGRPFKPIQSTNAFATCP